MWFDTHCHLDAAEFEADRDAVIARAVAAGVGEILVPAVGASNFDAVYNFQKNRRNAAGPPQGVAAPSGGASEASRGPSTSSAAPRFLHAFGVHPMYTPQAAEGDLALLRRRIEEQRPAAVGEIGLDGFVPGLDMARQEFFFSEQLRLAAEFDLPVVLHLRRAQDLVLKHLRRFRSHFAARGAGRAGIAHAFNGSRQQADQFIELGFCLGFGGAMTYDGSTRIRTLATELPLEAIVLETDAPDIPPAWLGGRRNEPAELPRIGGVLADLRGLASGVVAEVTTQNARRIFAPTS